MAKRANNLADFFQAVEDWGALCKRMEAWTPRYWSTSDAFPKAAEESRRILAALEKYGPAAVRAVHSCGGDSQIVQDWIDAQKVYQRDEWTKHEWEHVRQAVQHALTILETTKTPRKRRTFRQPTKLTPAQVEAVQLVGEHKGNYTAVGKATGKTRQAVTKLYKKGIDKVAATGADTSPLKTQALPADRRGQRDIADANAPDPTDID